MRGVINVRVLLNLILNKWLRIWTVNGFLCPAVRNNYRELAELFAPGVLWSEVGLLHADLTE